MSYPERFRRTGGHFEYRVSSLLKLNIYLIMITKKQTLIKLDCDTQFYTITDYLYQYSYVKVQYTA